jgi:hypothetical protein
MTAASRDPHKVQSALENAEEYQAPPRAHEQDVDGEQPPSGADDPVDLTLLEAQQGRAKPQMSETRHRPTPAPEDTVSSKDELADPANPRATPPGERM